MKEMISIQVRWIEFFLAHISYKQLDFSSQPAVAKQILRKKRLKLVAYFCSKFSYVSFILTQVV